MQYVTFGHRSDHDARCKHDYQAILEYIISYKTTHDGLSPSVAEIGAEFSIGSTAVVAHILQSLERAGKIRRLPGSSRNIQVIGGQWSYQP